MGQFGGIDAIEIIEPYLKDETARDEAALALTNISRRIKSSNGATAHKNVKKNVKYNRNIVKCNKNIQKHNNKNQNVIEMK